MSACEPSGEVKSRDPVFRGSESYIVRKSNLSHKFCKSSNRKMHLVPFGMCTTYTRQVFLIGTK